MVCEFKEYLLKSFCLYIFYLAVPSFVLSFLEFEKIIIEVYLKSINTGCGAARLLFAYLHCMRRIYPLNHR
jgi:hypothetical protein